MPTILHIVRHGENPANLTREFSCRLVDYSLTPRGIAQAECTAAYFAEQPIAAVYASPLKRASETAAIIARPHGLPVLVRDNFREIDVGAFEGQPPTDELWAEHNRIFTEWFAGNTDERFPDGESQRDLIARMGAGILEIVRAYPGQEVVIVAHGGILAATAERFCPNATEQVRGHMVNCAITTMAFDWTDGDLSGNLRAWAACEHLAALESEEAGEPETLEDVS